jgi:hypothetical protein
MPRRDRRLERIAETRGPRPALSGPGTAALLGGVNRGVGLGSKSTSRGEASNVGAWLARVDPFVAFRPEEAVGAGCDSGWSPPVRSAARSMPVPPERCGRPSRATSAKIWCYVLRFAAVQRRPFIIALFVTRAGCRPRSHAVRPRAIRWERRLTGHRQSRLRVGRREQTESHRLRGGAGGLEGPPTFGTGGEERRRGEAEAHATAWA